MPQTDTKPKPSPIARCAPSISDPGASTCPLRQMQSVVGPARQRTRLAVQVPLLAQACIGHSHGESRRRACRNSPSAHTWDQWVHPRPTARTSATARYRLHTRAFGSSRIRVDTPSGHEAAAIDVDDRASDKARTFRAQIRHRIGNLIRDTDARHRCVLQVFAMAQVAAVRR